ncbi:flavodoxin I [Orenia metallireducens]|uniref:Flavodoxin n=1 Tax=Orenia metallireducens TaxID=1413210 RepID=A0A285F1X6_9FIRM|nr:flavodoxin [Orenia metallireducens]PRX34712.1 flavodoxin I [Orenia metallireducens]SNY05295.1 flavodoxin I [Orenia metallireducens]
MTKAIIVYGSTTGNTEELSEIVEGVLTDKYEVKRINVIKAEVEMLKEFDLILLGSSTWGSGELQEDFYEFYDNLDEVDLSAKQGAVFGTGDESFPEFCGAVDILEDKLKDLGVNVLAEGFKWDGDINTEAEKQVENWVENL